MAVMDRDRVFVDSRYAQRMRKQVGILATFSLLATGCLFTSLQSPRTHKNGEVSGGLHFATVVADEETSDFGIVVGTARIGTPYGELGGSLSSLGFDGSYKYPLTDQDGSTHISMIAGAGALLFVLPYANAGLLVGQDLGPFTAYVGYRQYVLTEGLYSGDMIGGVELTVFKEISIMAEVNYNYLYTSDANADQDLIDAFDVPVVSIGLNFGSGRKRPKSAGALPPIQPPSPADVSTPPDDETPLPGGVNEGPPGRTLDDAPTSPDSAPPTTPGGW